jgi:hypothetical protein
VNALRRIHASLVPGGLVVDPQPVSPRPPVEAGDRQLGTLDMHSWRRTVDAVDRLVAQTIEDRLYVLAGEHRFVVTDMFDNGAELVETVSGWQGTRISAALAKHVRAAAPPMRVHQDVRLRLLRRTGPRA